MTYFTLRRFIFTLWFFGIVLSYLPLVGFGVYHKDGECIRFREATEPKDVIYAYVFFAFGKSHFWTHSELTVCHSGATLCLCITCCNITVICELARLGHQNKMLVRRVSRSIISNRVDQRCNRYATAEEIAFAKLMAILCVIFLVCWLPQLVSYNEDECMF